MIIEVELPTRTRATGPVHLSDVLAAIPENRWTWVVLDFDGVGVAPGGMPEFGDRVRAEGVPFTWEELLRFADGQEQTIDCLIVAERAGERVAEVEAFDGGAWLVRVPDEWERAVELLDGLRD
ncbi:MULTISPECIES: hypothetical protein [Actinosynnema]|uniref:hypothetical protein n=1 Tax=Actinosynnema TaxID=40566 RepID=UPI0020A373FC|nr:hypothetical protein [Actinosynnema pretiosum]MCP2097663.1 hypothetical protein [Actinosynnema pretiosum]